MLKKVTSLGVTLHLGLKKSLRVLEEALRATAGCFE